MGREGTECATLLQQLSLLILERREACWTSTLLQGVPIVDLLLPLMPSLLGVPLTSRSLQKARPTDREGEAETTSPTESGCHGLPSRQPAPDHKHT